jgi:hypothetical protein
VPAGALTSLALRGEALLGTDTYGVIARRTGRTVEGVSIKRTRQGIPTARDRQDVDGRARGG